MIGNEGEVEDDLLILFQYCYCPTAGATASTGVNLRVQRYLCYFQDAIAGTFLDGDSTPAIALLGVTRAGTRD